MRKKLAATALIMGITLSGCGTKAEDPLADGTLTIGLEADYAPYNWTTTKNKASDYAVELSDGSAYVDGYDIRMGEKIADELGVDLEVKKISWDGLIPALESGQIDAIVAGMSPTEERKEQINFTDAYFEDNAEQTVIVRADGKYKDATSLADLKGANISAQQGTYQVDLLEQIDLDKDASDPLPDYASLLQAAKSGTIDGYIVEKSVADAQTKDNKDLVELNLKDGFEISPDQTTSAIGVKKGNGELVDEINDALKTVDNATRNKWMDEAKDESGTN